MCVCVRARVCVAGDSKSLWNDLPGTEHPRLEPDVRVVVEYIAAVAADGTEPEYRARHV